MKRNQMLLAQVTCITHSSHSCISSLQIRDGSSTGAVLGTFCGTTANTVVGSGRTVVVQMTTDSSLTYPGFAARWSGE